MGALFEQTGNQVTSWVAARGDVPKSQRPQAPLPTPPSAAPPQAPECQRGTAPTLGETTGSATLSDQLSQSKGIICPPAGVDPGIAAPPVGGGVTPVIPPPGTPGGDPFIVPK
jgi:hypothetical protein